MKNKLYNAIPFILCALVAGVAINFALAILLSGFNIFVSIALALMCLLLGFILILGIMEAGFTYIRKRCMCVEINRKVDKDCEYCEGTGFIYVKREE